MQGMEGASSDVRRRRNVAGPEDPNDGPIDHCLIATLLRSSVFSDMYTLINVRMPGPHKGVASAGTTQFSTAAPEHTTHLP